MSDDHLEDAFIAECRRQGFQPNQNVMREAATILAGATLTHGLITLPSKGSISPADLARSLRAAMPESFDGVEDRPDSKPTVNLTESMRRELEAHPSKRALPSDWQTVRSKATGVTAEHLAERERHWK
ncbi:hypothetical protein HAP47_0005340 [Bradyrhizobium sp. 41S5]|uniref:hypothetical protein n=1 Tax=Bradyrhizobium sp. 41S5 TaxID=1404443 RepID=UPI00156B4822|nr:hypothetical protein [Bradyrhizobium sp. 41S5]UFX46136.1 hypothetical protein HAP47_0005340 [Bradyrhizobium sp. 41S5]